MGGQTESLMKSLPARLPSSPFPWVAFVELKAHLKVSLGNRDALY